MRCLPAGEAFGVNLELRIALERLVYLDAIRNHVLSAFTSTDNRRSRIRNSEVTKYVADRLGREFSPWLGRDVIQAMKAHGWRYVRHSNRPWWKGVKRL